MGYFVRQNYEIRNVGHHAHSRAEDQHTSLLGPGIEKLPCSWNMRVLIPLIMWFLCAQDAQCKTEESP